MSEPQAETQSDSYVVNYDFVNLNLDPMIVVRNAVIATATVVLVKTAMDISGRQLKTFFVSLARKSRAQAIDKAHEIAEADDRENGKNK